MRLAPTPETRADGLKAAREGNAYRRGARPPRLGKALDSSSTLLFHVPLLTGLKIAFGRDLNRRLLTATRAALSASRRARMDPGCLPARLRLGWRLDVRVRKRHRLRLREIEPRVRLRSRIGWPYSACHGLHLLRKGIAGDAERHKRERRRFPYRIERSHCHHLTILRGLGEMCSAPRYCSRQP